MTKLIQHRTILVQIGILFTFLLTFMWSKWDNPPAPFTANYVIGFHITHVMLFTIIAWCVTGFSGIRDFVKSKIRLVWVISLLLLLGWITISQTWAYGLDRYPGLAPNAALQFALVTAFSICVACISPSPRWIIAVLMLALVIHGLIGSLQVIQQESIGLSRWGEIALNPEQSGISVIQSGDLRWLRPYGLLPHPNIFAGVITIGLLASSSWVLTDDKRYWIGVGVFVFGFAILLVTFSRGAWLGFFIGILFALPFVIRQNNFWKKFLPPLILSVLIGLLFVGLFRPLLLSRAGIAEEGIELRSLSDRRVFNNIALEAIREYPFHGVGIANFPWYASVYIFYNTDYDLRGTSVHNIYLGILSEIGVIGFALFAMTFSSGFIAGFRQRNTERIALLAGVIAFAIIGFVDHYPWTLIHTQTLWFGILAVCIKNQASFQE